MFSVPEGRAANQLFSVVTFSADLGVVARGFGELGGDVLAGQLGGRDVVAGKLGELLLLLQGGRRVDSLVPAFAKAIDLLLMQLGRVLAGLGGDFRSQQVRDQTILIGGPHTAVLAQEAHAGALFAAEGDFALEQRVNEPLEADRNLNELGVDGSGHAVDQGGGHQRLADAGASGQPGRLPPNRYSTHTAM